MQNVRNWVCIFNARIVAGCLVQKLDLGTTCVGYIIAIGRHFAFGNKDHFGTSHLVYRLSASSQTFVVITCNPVSTSATSPSDQNS